MCGRYQLRQLHRWTEIARHRLGVAIEASLPSAEVEGYERYIIAPQQDVLVYLDGRLQPLRWGLVPPWAEAEQGYNGFINARAETVATKASFKQAFRHGRCLVPADGFYEWQSREGGGAKQPYKIELTSGEPFAFAGIAERNGTFAILTCETNALTAQLHHRMAVMLPAEHWAEWIDRRTPPERLAGLLRPYAADEMRAVPVSTLVNKPGNEGPEVGEPIGPPLGEGPPPPMPGQQIGLFG